jgi:cytochrome b6-f complex iron-sulfur subunit
MRAVRSFVRDLLRQHRTRPVRVEPEHDDELRVAIALRAARLGAGEPSEDFVTALHQRLADELADPEPAPKPVTRRRRVVQAAAVAAASAAVGVGFGRTLTGSSVAQPPTPAQPTLSPNDGEWRTVVASAALPEGGVHGFDLGTVTGFVRRSEGQVHAVSGVCTHLGCRLMLNNAARRLDCPCHTASFALDGAVLHHQLPITLTALPVIQVRENGGAVQVLVPPPGA